MFLSFCTNVFAAPVGCPAPFKGENFRNYGYNIGVESDFIFNRKLDHAGMQAEDVNLEGAWVAGKFGYTFFDRINAYGLLGGMEWEVKQERSDSTTVTYSTNMEMAWGLGASVLLYETDNGITLSADTRFRQQKPNMKRVRIDGQTTKDPVSLAKLREWQMSLGASLDMAKVIYSPQKFRYIPYIGAKISKINVQTQATVSSTDYAIERAKANESFGVFAGCDIYFSEAPENEQFNLNIEGRFLDESALTISVNYKF
jgi:hypothetical protein